MIRLYQGSGSSEMKLVGLPTPRNEWAELRQSVTRLLRARMANKAADLLEQFPFDLYNGTNCFEDEFSLLYMDASLNQYVELGEQSEKAEIKLAFRKIAETITEVGPYIRFIAVELATKNPLDLVSTPSLAVTSDIVERALADCEQLIHSRGATSGVDRIHTAFHGYLRTICTKGNLKVPQDAGVTQLFKAIREQHPSFAEVGPRASDIDRITRSMATIIDSLNPLRNQATLAHPNDAILEEAEAMMVINSIRTLLHYLNAKFQ